MTAQFNPSPWQRCVRILGLFVASWAAGVGGYLACLAVFYGQPVSSGDLTAVLFWSLLMFGLSFFALYLPALFGVRRRLGGVRPWWPFPLVAVLLGIVPVALIVLFNGGGIRALASAEAYLFYVLFGVTGIVVGAGFAFAYRDAVRL